MFALQLYSAWLGLKGERLKRAAVSLLESLASLALEDNKLAGHWGNCLAYLDAGLTALQVSFLLFLLDIVCILQALGGSNYLLSLEHLSKTRVINLLPCFQSVQVASLLSISGLFKISEIQHEQPATARG